MMAKLSTIGALSITDGRLMGDIGKVYEVVSFFIGRSAYTHELPKYGRQIAPIITSAFPALTADPELPWDIFRNEVLAQFGGEIDVPDEWENSLSDGKNAVETLVEVMGPTHDR